MGKSSFSEKQIKTMIKNNPNNEKFAYLLADNNTYYKHEYGELITEYLETEHGKKICRLLTYMKQKKEITRTQYEEVILSSTHDYKICKKHSEIDGDLDLYQIIQAFPEVFSIIDIIKYKLFVQKMVFIIPAQNVNEVEEFFENSGYPYKSYVEQFKTIDFCIFVLIDRPLPKSKARELPLDVDRIISTELGTRRKIRFGFVSYKRAPNGLLGREIGMNASLPKLSDFQHKSKTGYRQDIDLGFRSSWEANIARILDLKNIHWKYEEKSFSLSSKQFSGYYFPDFFLENNVIIEVKGFWNEQSRYKVSLFRIQYPEFQLLIIDNDLYFDLQKIYRNFLPQWELSPCNIAKQLIQVKKAKNVTSKRDYKLLEKGDELSLTRLKNNQNSDLIEVYAKNNLLLGTVSDEWSWILSQKIDLGITYSVKYIGEKGNYINIEIMRKNLDEIITHPIFSIL